MSTTPAPSISGRDRAILRAIAEGRGMVSNDYGNPLTIDGLRCADQFAKSRLTSAHLLVTAGQAPAPVFLTPAGHAALTAA